MNTRYFACIRDQDNVRLEIGKNTRVFRKKTYQFFSRKYVFETVIFYACHFYRLFHFQVSEFRSIYLASFPHFSFFPVIILLNCQFFVLSTLLFFVDFFFLCVLVFFIRFVYFLLIFCHFFLTVLALYSFLSLYKSIVSQPTDSNISYIHPSSDIFFYQSIFSAFLPIQ